MADFLSAAETVFVKLQYAWTARDWESCLLYTSKQPNDSLRTVPLTSFSPYLPST